MPLSALSACRPRTPEVRPVQPQAVRTASYGRTVFTEALRPRGRPFGGSLDAGRQQRSRTPSRPTSAPPFPVSAHYTRPSASSSSSSRPLTRCGTSTTQRGIPSHQVINAVYAAVDHHPAYAAPHRTPRPLPRDDQVNDAKALSGSRSRTRVQGVSSDPGPAEPRPEGTGLPRHPKPLPSQARPGPNSPGLLKRAVCVVRRSSSRAVPPWYARRSWAGHVSNRFPQRCVFRRSGSIAGTGSAMRRHPAQARPVGDLQRQPSSRCGEGLRTSPIRWRWLCRGDQSLRPGRLPASTRAWPPSRS